MLYFDESGYTGPDLTNIEQPYFTLASIKMNDDEITHMKKDIGYDIPPMTPYVGQAFNQTRAGIHADGLMKDEEIYTIFDTKKILNKPATVQISKTSGLAGIAYWINQTYGLEGEQLLDKRSELVVAMKEWVDQQYEEGRQTCMTEHELEEKIEELAPGRYHRG